MQGKNVSKISRAVMNFFKKTVEEVDKTVKFVMRRSKLNACLFVEALVTGCLADPTITLDALLKLLKKRGVKITKQGLHQRFNSKATTLMKDLLTKSLHQVEIEKTNVLDLLKPFSSVKIIDSSGISLPNRLKQEFKGCGGAASEAGLKIQMLFDYTQGQISEVTLTDGCKNDQSFDEHLKNIERNTLYLQDLGYFKLKSFESMSHEGAFFISRYLHPTAVLSENQERLDLILELRKAGMLFTKEVLLGSQKKIKVRLIAFRLPAEEVEKRIRKIRQSSKKRGHTPTKETLELTQWSIYITNVPESILNEEQIHLIYTLRWQIELLFKLCKSNAGIDKMHGKKSSRILCEIYAKLICIALLFNLCFPIRWQNNQEISFYKAYKLLQSEASDFFLALKSPYRLTAFIKKILCDLIDFAFKDKYRRNRPPTHQKIMASIGQEALA